MIDLGTVRPGSTIRIPFSSFDKDDGSSITMTNYAAADILIYKDGSTTERASTAGFTATTDFDSKTGKHLAIIDLSDNTVADFWKAGSEYLVAIDAVTVDAVTTGGWIARFRIGYPNAYLDTSIATLASQTSFTLTAGPADDDALNGMVLLVHAKASAVQVTRVVVEDYTGSTKTVTLRAAPATTFTIAAGDNVSAVGYDTANVTHVGGTAQTARDIGATLGVAGAGLTSIPDSSGVTTLLGRLSSARAGYLDNLSAGAVALASALSTAQTDISTLLTRLSSARAGYLDNLSGGAVALAADLATVAGYLDTEIAAILAAVDTEIAAIKAKTDLLPSDPADSTDVPTAAANAAALLDYADAIETGWTLRKVLRILAAGIGGKSSGGPGSPVFRSITDAADRITATVDSSGNRTAVTLNGA